LLINFPVDTRGRIHENDVAQIQKLANALKNDFSEDLARMKDAAACNVRGRSKKFDANNVTDGNPESYWATDESVLTASLIVDLDKPTKLNRFLVQEYIPLGQRVKKFNVEAFVDGDWVEVASETTIGRKRILRLDEITASKVRLNILEAKACPLISNVEIYKAPKVLVEPTVLRSKNGMVKVETYENGLDIYYTLDGTEPNMHSIKYSEPFLFAENGILKVIAIDPESGNKSPVRRVEFDLVKTKWKFAGSLKNERAAFAVFDGDENTAWSISGEKPVEYVIDLGESVNISGFKYLPDQGRGNPGVINSYEFYVSTDARHWGKSVSAGEFPNIKNSPVWQTKTFAPVRGRYVKFKALSPAEKNGRIGIAEFGIISQ